MRKTDYPIMEKGLFQLNEQPHLGKIRIMYLSSDTIVTHFNEILTHISVVHCLQ